MLGQALSAQGEEVRDNEELSPTLSILESLSFYSLEIMIIFKNFARSYQVKSQFWIVQADGTQSEKLKAKTKQTKSPET